MHVRAVGARWSLGKPSNPNLSKILWFYENSHCLLNQDVSPRSSESNRIVLTQKTSCPGGVQISPKATKEIQVGARGCWDPCPLCSLSTTRVPRLQRPLHAHMISCPGSSQGPKFSISLSPVLKFPQTGKNTSDLSRDWYFCPCQHCLLSGGAWLRCLTQANQNLHLAMKVTFLWD